mmetsp:Transcript_2137/g.2458  ORF Transcript_2137/g.2458 Transcript_2137/m.2458 type:complete len:502 (-) Transcript_2137:72-1577(-)
MRAIMEDEEVEEKTFLPEENIDPCVQYSGDNTSLGIKHITMHLPVGMTSRRHLPENNANPSTSSMSVWEVEDPNHGHPKRRESRFWFLNLMSHKMRSLLFKVKTTLMHFSSSAGLCLCILTCALIIPGGIIKVRYYRHTQFLNMMSYEDIISSEFSNLTPEALKKPGELLLNIKHKCLPQVPDKKCHCPNPFTPSTRADTRPNWMFAHNVNTQLALESASRGAHHLDIVFFGDSITEHWRGTKYGHDVTSSSGLQGAVRVFDKLFNTENGGKLEGLPLGLSGDTTHNLLWRLQNGELPAHLNPSVYWLLIGTNDFGDEECSAEMCLLGIIRVIEELRKKKPYATIVVNSLLPRTNDAHGYLFWIKKLRRRKAPRIVLWPHLLAVNKQLESYCRRNQSNRKHDERYGGLLFFNATNIFLEKYDGMEDDPSQASSLSINLDLNLLKRDLDSQSNDIFMGDQTEIRINHTLMENDFLHPSPVGHYVWGVAIVNFLLENNVTNDV